MELGSQPMSRDGDISHCRSLGSNCHPSSQSRKISIGIIGESSKTKPKTTTEEEDKTAVGQKMFNSQNNAMRNGRVNGGKGQCEYKNPSALEQTSSPWVSTRLFQQQHHTSTTLHAKENTQMHAASGGSYSRSSAAKEARVTITQTAKINQKAFRVIQNKAVDNVAQRETVELSFPKVDEVHTPVKEMIEDKTSKTVTRSTEGLRMKLMEILGATSTPINPASEFQPPDMTENTLKDDKSQPVLQPTQDSDTIEKDSEDPVYTAKRPVTRSLLRKKASTKVRESKSGSRTHFIPKRKKQEKNAFSFVDGLSRQHDGASRGGPKSVGKNMGKKSLKIDPNKSLFSTHCKATEIRKTANGSKLKAPASSYGNLPSEKKGIVGEPDTRYRDDASLELPMRNKRDQTLFNAQCKATEIGQTANGKKLKAPAEKIYSHGNKTVTSHNLSSEKKGNVDEPDTRHRDNASLESPLRNKRDQTCDISFPNVDEPHTRHRDDGSPQSPLRSKRDQTSNISFLARESNQQEEFFDPSLKNIVEPFPVFDIPMYGTRPSPADFPLGSPIKATHGSKNHTGDADEFDSGKFHGFISFLSPAPYHCKTPVEAELSDAGEEHEEYHFTPWNFTTEQKGATVLPEQCSEDTHFDGSPEISVNEGLPERCYEETHFEESPEISVNGGLPEQCYEETHFDGSPEISVNGGEETEPESPEHESPEIANLKEASFTRHPNKKFRSQEGSEINGFSPFVDSLKETEHCNGEDSDQDNEDALETVVTILSLALERIEKKINAATAKKSADIITSTAQEIRLQLQTTDSHIQKDMGKLINLAKLKRKSGEARLEEKQERLRVIYEKFKHDVNQHLQECKNIVCELGSQEAEFKETMEKQNAFHRKLITQAEEVVEAQLKNADRRVKALNELAREKTLHLRNAIAAFLEEDDILT